VGVHDGSRLVDCPRGHAGAPERSTHASSSSSSSSSSDVRLPRARVETSGETSGAAKRAQRPRGLLRSKARAVVGESTRPPYDRGLRSVVDSCDAAGEKPAGLARLEWGAFACRTVKCASTRPTRPPDERVYWRTASYVLASFKSPWHMASSVSKTSSVVGRRSTS